MMARIFIAALAFAIAFCGGTRIANSQSNPGFNPDLTWCNTQGSIAIRGPVKWQCLTPGTSGQSLLSGGPGAIPYWNTITGTGTVTSVTGSGGTTGMTLTGGPITGAGTLTLGGTLDIANGGTGAAGTAAASRVFATQTGGLPGFRQVTDAMMTTGTLTNASISASAAITPSKFATQPALSVLANITGGAAVPTTPTVTALLDAAFSSTQGSVLFRNLSGWSALTPGTNGQFLATGGGGANPSWQTVSGGNIGSIPTGTVLANISGSTAAPANPTVSQLLDATIGSTQGMIAYRNGTVWTTLATGTSGAMLKTNGAAADPAWSTLGQIKGEPSNATASAGNIGEEIASNILAGSAVSLPGGNVVAITSIVLTPGDWDISAMCYLVTSAGSPSSTPNQVCSISTAPTTLNVSPFIAQIVIPYTGTGSANSFAISPARVTISSNTTYYLSGYLQGGGSGYGQIRARRMR